MKKVFAILFSVIILGSVLNISVDRHYCFGKLADTKISLTGAMASCGMEAKEHNGSGPLSFENTCCQDQLTFYNISSTYIPGNFKLSHLLAVKNIPATGVLNLDPGSSEKYDFTTQVQPPGDKFVSGVLLSRICVLRI